MMKSPVYPPLDGLVDLACRDGVDIRPTLLRVLTDLFVQKPTHSDAEETQYVELALGLIEAVDAPTRAAVAASLSSYPAAPTSILRKLNESGSPFGSQTSTQIEAVTDDLAELFFAAEAKERHLILANLDAGSTAPARRPAPVSSEVIRRLEMAALQHNAGEFGRILERTLGISRQLAERIVRDQSGEPIVVAAKALGMTASVLQRVLLFLNPAIGQSVERVHELSHLFDDLTPRAAEGMLAIWKKFGGQARPVHEPAHYDNERRSARSLTTPTQRRAIRDRDEQPARTKTSGC